MTLSQNGPVGCVSSRLVSLASHLLEGLCARSLATPVPAVSSVGAGSAVCRHCLPVVCVRGS